MSSDKLCSFHTFLGILIVNIITVLCNQHNNSLFLQLTKARFRFTSTMLNHKMKDNTVGQVQTWGKNDCIQYFQQFNNNKKK